METIIYLGLLTIVALFILDNVEHHSLKDKINGDTKSVSIFEHWCNKLSEKGIM